MSARRPDYMLKPKKARSTRGDAWWYANPKTIDVFVHEAGKTFQCRIRRSDLLRYIEATKP